MQVAPGPVNEVYTACLWDLCNKGHWNNAPMRGSSALSTGSSVAYPHGVEGKRPGCSVLDLFRHLHSSLTTIIHSLQKLILLVECIASIVPENPA